MLELNCIATGSHANQYILKNDNEELVIECGLKYTDLLLHFQNIREVKGCLVSHFHADHNAKNGKLTTSEMLAKVGIIVLTPNNTRQGIVYTLGGFKVIPIAHKHNAPCNGYIIKVDNEIIYFATDLQTPIILSGIKVDHFLIECNYIEEIRIEGICKSNATMLHLNSIAQNHCSLETLVEYFSLLGYKPKNIITLHKSNSALMEEQKVVEDLKDFAENVQVANNKTKYILKGEN